MIRIREKNINTPEYWNIAFEKEIKNGTLRIEPERFSRTTMLIKDNSNVIDIGCGRGEFIEHLLKSKHLCHVLGIDFSESAVLDAKKRIPGADFAAIDVYMMADYASLLEKYDYAVCFEVIEHLDRPDVLVNNIYKILKKNGYLILSTPYENSVYAEDEHIYSYDFQDIINLFNKHDWNIITMTRYHRNYSNMYVLIQKI